LIEQGIGVHFLTRRENHDFVLVFDFLEEFFQIRSLSDVHLILRAVKDDGEFKIRPRDRLHGTVHERFVQIQHECERWRCGEFGRQRHGWRQVLDGTVVGQRGNELPGIEIVLVAVFLTLFLQGLHTARVRITVVIVLHIIVTIVAVVIVIQIVIHN
jgi:hypothetical protein